MNLLPLQKPLELLQLDVLIRRYRDRDKLFHLIDDQYQRDKAGYHGESALQYYFNLLRHQESYTLFDLRCEVFSHFFQIDALLITRQFMLIVESKHVKGVITENDAKQMVQYVDGEPKPLQHPLHQAAIQKRQLETFLKVHNLNHLPIFTCGTFTHPEAIIDMPNQSDNLFTYHYLLQYIYDLLDEHPTPIISDQKARAIGQCLTNNHAPRNRHLTTHYNITSDALIRGAFCPTCTRPAINRVHGTWFCPSCQTRDRNAHIPVLKDLIILHQKPYVTNKEVRQWLNIDSPDVTKRLLAQFPKFGHKRTTVYDLSSLVPELQTYFRRKFK
ncbi:hypothetical protein ABID56_001144 [Alkalibacillus flavidus]|uniref:NERD domain-containing protein n=1 Tax=Alkalibacillus flavidus TaxID=546021 RepID=A0ABV2KTZ5_9BACI